MQSLHYCTCFTRSNVYFLILSPVTRECNPKILELLHLFQLNSIHLQRALDRIFRKMKYLSFVSANFHSSSVACSCKLIYRIYSRSAVALQLRAPPKVSARAPAHRSYHFRGVKFGPKLAWAPPIGGFGGRLLRL